MLKAFLLNGKNESRRPCHCFYLTLLVKGSRWSLNQGQCFSHSKWQGTLNSESQLAFWLNVAPGLPSRQSKHLTRGGFLTGKGKASSTKWIFKDRETRMNMCCDHSPHESLFKIMVMGTKVTSLLLNSKPRQKILSRQLLFTVDTEAE